jgi:hypothetical protein
MNKKCHNQSQTFSTLLGEKALRQLDLPFTRVKSWLPPADSWPLF